MATYDRVYDSCHHLQADCQEPGSASELYTRQSSMGYIYFNLRQSLTHNHSARGWHMLTGSHSFTCQLGDMEDGSTFAASDVVASTCAGYRPSCVMLVASRPRRRRAPRLDESIVQGTEGAGGGACNAALSCYIRTSHSCVFLCFVDAACIVCGAGSM